MSSTPTHSVNPSGPELPLHDADSFDQGDAPRTKRSPRRGYQRLSEDGSHDDVPVELVGSFQDEEIKPTPRWMSSLHLIKCFMGSGVLGLGFGFREVGWAVGIFGFILMGLVNTTSMISLVRAKNVLAKRLGCKLLTYAQVSEHFLGKWAGRATTFCLSLTQLGFSTAYIIFFSQTIASLYPTTLTHSMLALIIFPFLVGVSLIKNIKRLVPFSLIADVGHIGGICGLCVLIWIHLNSDGASGSPKAIDGDWTTIPIFFGIAVYAFEGIGVILPIETSMKDQSKFNLDLSLTICLIEVLFVTLAGSCYMTFGHDTQDIIIKNLAPFFGWETLLTATALCVAVLFTYPISMYPVFELVESLDFMKVHADWKHFAAFRNMVRTVIVSCTLAVAISVPKFGLFLSLVGSLAASALVYVFPPLYDMVLMYSRAYKNDDDVPVPPRAFRRWQWTAYLLCVMTIGVIGAITGTYESVVKLVDAFMKGEL